MLQARITFLSLLVLSLPSLAAQQTVTVPAGYDSTDAPSRLWVAGVSASMRQQIVIDARHLSAMQGQSIAALLFRREAANEAYQGGTANLTVQLSQSLTVDALSASGSFAANAGVSPLTVFSGAVTIPAAPAMLSGSVGWNATQTLRIPFSQHFFYTGGSLIVDIVGLTTNQAVAWWPADAVRDSATGAVQSVGTGCGSHANPAGEWASAAASTLVPGATSLFYARGTEQGLALMLLGLPPSPVGMPLQYLLPGAAPTCHIYMPLPATALVGVFSLVPHPGEGGVAQIWLPIPNSPWVLGATFGSQWMDLQQNFSTSNGVSATFSATVPSLGMCSIQGEVNSAHGIVTTNLAHVLRFDYQ